MGSDFEADILSLKLEYLEAESWQWCQQEGLEWSLGARLAHILSLPDFFARPRTPSIHILPTGIQINDAWRSLSEWRHPRINMNLLQLALTFQNMFGIKYLWHPVFLREEDYRDESGKLVNHPLHLNFRINTANWIPNLDGIRDELFYEEGIIDLTPSRILKQTCNRFRGQSHLDVFLPSSANAARFGIGPVSEADARNARLNVWWRCFPYIPPWRFLTTSEPVRLAPLIVSETRVYGFKLALNALLKLAGGEAQPSTVDLVMNLATDTSYDRCMSDDYDTWWRLETLPKSLKEETLILLCQCTWTVPDAKRRLERFQALFERFDMLVTDNNEIIEKAARYLSQDLLRFTIEVVKRVQNSPGGIANPQTAQILQDTLAKRNLKDHCVLAVMEAVRGDARKVWSLDQLPELVKKRFHLPFLTTYQQLTAARQRQLQPQHFVSLPALPEHP